MFYAAVFDFLPLFFLFVPAHRVTAAQMSLAVLFGLTCTALNVWLLHKERLSRHEEAPPVVLESVEPVPAQQPGEPRPRSKASSNGKPTGLGFDNPNWVYGTSESNQAGPLKVGKSPQQQQPEQIPAIAAASSSEKPTECGTIMRYATIRRATITSIHGALLPDRPHIQDPPQRPQRLNKSASFRFESEQLRRGSAIVHRSKTMRETSLTSNTFAQRFQARGSDGPSALSFVHDAISEEPPQSLAEKCSIQQVVEQRAVVPSNVPPPPPRPATRPPPIHSVRSSDRIVLRVESFRGSAAMHQPGRTGGRQPTGRAAGRSNVKRVSSSTQTDLSGLSNSSRHQSQQQRGNNGSKRSSVGSGHSSKYSGPSLVVASDEHSAGSGQPPQLSPVESSSGYSSPRGTTDESKSPTPEPPVSAVASSSSNITVIHIEPPPLYHLHPDMQEERQQEPKRVVEATYAIPRKRSERNNSGTSPITPATPTKATPQLENIRCVSIQKQQQPQSSTNRPATFINRSVSFHQMSQSDRRAVYSQEWLGIQQQHPGSSLEVLTTSQSPQVTIPRPALRMSPSPNLYHQQHPHYMTSPSPTSSTTSSMTGRRSNLNRSTSMYLAMSEIQRKLDILQVLTNSNRPQQHQVVPVHHQQHNRQPDDYYSQHYHTHRPSSKRSHSRQGVPTDWSNDSMDSAKTLAYLAELEQLARHWRTQLLYKVLDFVIPFMPCLQMIKEI